MTNRYPVIRSSMPSKEEYFAEISDLWESHWLTNHGAKVEELEAKAKDRLDAQNAMCFVNGHQALEVAIQALGLKGEIITTPFTFVSTTAAIVRCGCTPVFCDIREDDFTMDADQIESLITENTCAILPVHVYGNICDVEKIGAIARKHGLKVIYDAAHAFGVQYHGRGVGRLGDVSMFSMHATKVLNSIEGGLLTYADEALSDVLWHLQNFGITGPGAVEWVGTNAKMNEFQAAMGLCNMRHLDEYIAARKKAYERYQTGLKDIPGLRAYKVQDHIKPNYAYFPILIDPAVAGVTRDQLADALMERGIGSRKYFAPLTSEFAPYAMYSRSTPVAERISEQVLTIPMYSDLSEEDVDEICNAIREVMTGEGE